MIKEALEWLVKTANMRTYDIGEQTFSTDKLYPILEPTAAAISVRTLSGLVEYIKSEFDGDTRRFMVHVESPTEVSVFDTFNKDMDRNTFIKAVAMVPSFPFDRYIDPENFIIKLQAGFEETDDRDILLKVVGNIKDENVRQIGDDGVSQSVVAKVGTATVADVQVPNPVVLAPYRTFVEVTQPQSKFIFRMQTGPSAGLYEADGGAWKLEAMANIKEYLERELSEKIGNGFVDVIA